MPDPGLADLLVQRLDPGLPMPARAHPGDAGFDLRARCDARLAPGQRMRMPTGIAMALPAGYAAFVHPRSGLADRRGLGMVNAPGTIDAGYRGEVMVLLVNHDPSESIQIVRGERIAQFVVHRLPRVVLHEVSALPGSHRGTGGFGSTGVA